MTIALSSYLFRECNCVQRCFETKYTTRRLLKARGVLPYQEVGGTCPQRFTSGICVGTPNFAL